MEKDIQMLITDWCRRAVAIYESNPDMHALGIAEGLIDAASDLLPWTRPDAQEE